ncbi:MAG: hypothetical protein CMP11_04670 [Zetaproteobacteria bacterium]|nr:hypothetical protein [Pseudobdellovibrionaceae bacterium]|tara:strand:+ start:1077 stop:1310 length:234 start_codon:yes stop_codon:yes gene_type:complete
MTWNVDFRDLKAEAIYLEPLANTFEWVLIGMSGLLSLALFVAAANASKNGDGILALFCSIGAVVVAVGPYVAKTFIA